MKILFTGGGGAGNESIWRQFGDRHELHFADADQHAISPSIPSERRHAIPFAVAPDFTDQLLNLATDLSIDMIVPGVDEELGPVASLRERSSIHILAPDATFIALMLDKLEASRALHKAGLSVPRTRPLTDVGDIPFPLIAKPRTGRGSRGVERLERPSQVAAYLEMQNGPEDLYIAQELGSGVEYTVFVCANENAKLRAVIPVRVISKKGITIQATTENNPTITAYTEQFQAHFRATGIYNIQCTLADDGIVMPFEVNPRVSTTFCLATSTGFDPFSLNDKDTGIFVPSETRQLRRHWINAIA